MCYFLLYKENGVKLVKHNKKTKLICVSCSYPSYYFLSFGIRDTRSKPIFNHVSPRARAVKKRERDQKMRQESNDRSQSTGAIEDDASNEVSVRIREKEGSVTLKYPMLTKCNYAAWVIKMEVFMMAQGVWEAIESPETLEKIRCYSWVPRKRPKKPGSC